MSSPGGVSSPTSPGDPRGEDEEEEEGEELLDEKKIISDYKAIPELDRYEAKGIDEGEYQEMSPSTRREAESKMRERDADERRLGGRVPAALLTPTDDEGEEAAAVRPRRVRRVGEGAEGEEMVAADIEDDFDLERRPGDNLKEFLAQDLTRRQIKKRFKQFLTDFKDDSGHIIYPNAIQAMGTHNKKSLEISYTHLSNAAPSLALWLVDQPTTMLELFSEALKESVKAVFPRYRYVADEVHVRLTEIPVSDSLRDLRVSHTNALVKCEGVVTRRTSVFPQLATVKYDCKKCGAVLGPYVQQQNQRKEVKPNMCPECQTRGPFEVNLQQTQFRNYQRVTLQESPGSVPAGRVPRQKVVVLLHDLVDTVSPGEEVEITGVYMQTFSASLNAQTGFPVFDTFIVANNVTKRETWESLRLTDDDTKHLEQLSRKPNIGELVVNSIAPSIYGHRTIKTAIALSIFGGTGKKRDKTHLRGDINLLILGDPGTAKSQFLKYIEQTAPRAVYTTGKGASAVGLTASVRRDTLTKEWTLEGGALVLADTGVCLIDEFDKMNENDRTSLHEAMEQQSISVSKAGIVATLKARCAVIAAANPVKGRYDSQATFKENVLLTDAILSRFDVLCVVKDQIDLESDKRLARFVVESHEKNHPQALDAKEDRADEKEAGERLDQQTLRKYIMYAKRDFRPTLGSTGHDRIANFYRELRRESSACGGVPVAIRHLESIIRLSEAHAKMHLRIECTDDDVNVAIMCMVESFINAQKFAVKTALQKTFRRYLTQNRDHFELLLIELQSMVSEFERYRLVTGYSNVGGTTDPLEIPADEFAAKALEIHISKVEPFYKSKLFTSHGFTYDKERKVIIKTYT